MDNLYKAVNSMASVKFIINNDLLNYLKGEDAETTLKQLKYKIKERSCLLTALK